MSTELPRPKPQDEQPQGPAVARVQGKRTGLKTRRRINAKLKKRYLAAMGRIKTRQP
jgi:hypothetical protein